MSEIHTVSYYDNYEKHKIDAILNDPTNEIISKKIQIGDTIHFLPLHLEPSPSYLVYRTTIRYRKKSPRQHVTSVTRAGQTAKTRGDTNEFISAFWVNGKPKCRKGYRYDFRSKMCRLIK